MSKITRYIHDFFTWWSQGLYKGLPDSLRKWVQTDSAKLILKIKADDKVEAIWYQDGKSQERGDFSLNDAHIELSDLIPKKFHKKKYFIELQLDQKQVLFLQKKFPENLKDNLTQAIRYQIDRLTPFSSNNVFFDATVGEYDKSSKHIIADIFVASRQMVEAISEKLKALGIENIDLISVSNSKQALNLSTDGMPNANVHNKVSRKPLLFMLAVLVLSLILPVAYKARRINQLDEAISQLRSTASQQIAIRDKLFEAEDALNFLKEKRASSPMALDVVETLSKTLPKDTWLERLELNNKTLEIRGESEKALALIDILEESPAFSDVKFNSPVSLNKKNHRDKFHIQATVEVSHG